MVEGFDVVFEGGILYSLLRGILYCFLREFRSCIQRNSLKDSLTYSENMVEGFVIAFERGVVCSVRGIRQIFLRGIRSYILRDL